MTGWLQIKPAAKYAGVSPGTIRTWIKKRGLKHSRIGGLILVRVQDIDEFLVGFCENHNLDKQINRLVDETIREMRF